MRQTYRSTPYGRIRTLGSEDHVGGRVDHPDDRGRLDDVVLSAVCFPCLRAIEEMISEGYQGLYADLASGLVMLCKPHCITNTKIPLCVDIYCGWQWSSMSRRVAHMANGSP